MKTMKKLLFTATMAAWALAASAVTDILGDVNFDDRVDAKDASWMLAEYASQSTSQGTTFTDPQQKINADVNGNGVVDAIDASVTLAFYSFLSTGGSGRMEDWLADDSAYTSPAVAPPVSSDGNVVDENAHPDDALNKPVLTVTVDGKEGGRTFLLSEARGRAIDCTIKVSGASKQYGATGLRVHYSDKLLLATNHLGRIAVEPGEAVKQLARSNPVEDPTAPAGMKGFFAATAGKANYGLDGTMWTFSFTLSDDVEPGDVLPIDIVFRASESGWDRFSCVEDNAAGRNMEAYLFTKGIYTAVHTNAFATGADVAACAALAGIAGDADGYIAIADPASVAYPLWVGGVQVCETNKNDILGDGTASFAGTASGGTLALSNATITATHAFEKDYESLWTDSATVFSGEGFDLTISLTGSNILQNADHPLIEDQGHGYGVRSQGNLAITGGGALVAWVEYNGAGIDTDGNLLIDEAVVTAHSGQDGIRVGGSLAISNAVVTACGGGYDGISGGDGDIVIADSVVTATGWAGIEADGHTVAVSGASVVTAEATWGDESAWALCASALVLRDGLAITEPAGGAFDGGAGCVLDPATGKAALRVVIDRRFAVTVEGGSTTNSPARAGETVTVVADDPEEGKAFVGWSADDAMDVTFATPVAATTTFEMPARAATVTATFKDILIDAIPDQEWTGSAVEPVVRVQLDGVDQVLFAGTDYTVSYTNNVDPGTATATVTMAPPRTGHASMTFQILPPPEPPAVSNVVARQRWPWNGLVDVDYEVGGSTNLLAGVTARITFEERIEGGTGRIWVASNFLAGAEPSVEPGPHRATWNTAADGLTDVVAAVKATVNLVGTGNENGLSLVAKTVLVTPVDPASEPSCVVVNGNGYLLTNDPEGVGIDFKSGHDSAKLGEVVGITLDPDKVKDFFDSPDSLQLVPSEGIKLVDPATGDKVDSLEVRADGSVTLFVTADQVVPGGSITVHGDGKTVVIDNINFYDSVPEGWVGVVVTSASSAEFRLDTREGPRESDGTETLTYSTLWHPAGDATVTILQDGDEDEPVASGLLDEGDAVWQVFEDGTYVLTHVTTTNVAVSPVCNEETATFVVRGHPLVEAALRWKYAKNANGWHCAQVALTWHPSYADEISDMRLLFADRYEDSEPLAVIKVLDDDQAAFFEVPEMIKMAGNDWKYYFLNDENGKVYSERFLEGGYEEKLEERPTVSDGDEAGTLTSWSYSDSTRYITNGVLNADGTSFSDDITVNGRKVTLKFASSPHGLGRRTAYLVDPATVIDPLGTTETYRDVEYRVAPVDLTAFAGLADGARAVYGVSDATMASSLDSVPRAERLICLRVVNRDYSTVGRADNKLAILAWKVGGLPRFLPIAETMSSLQDGGGVHQPAQQPAQQPAPRPLSVEEANLSAAFGLAPAAVARGAVTCRVSSMSFGEDGSVEGTFAVAAENARGIVAESGELADDVKLAVLGAESLGGSFEPLDDSCGAELLSRKPPYAFRVKSPGKNAFFKIRLEADDLFE